MPEWLESLKLARILQLCTQEVTPWHAWVRRAPPRTAAPCQEPARRRLGALHPWLGSGLGLGEVSPAGLSWCPGAAPASSWGTTSSAPAWGGPSFESSPCGARIWGQGEARSPGAAGPRAGNERLGEAALPPGSVQLGPGLRLEGGQLLVLADLRRRPRQSWSPDRAFRQRRPPARPSPGGDAALLPPPPPLAWAGGLPGSLCALLSPTG